MQEDNTQETVAGESGTPKKTDAALSKETETLLNDLIHSAITKRLKGFEQRLSDISVGSGEKKPEGKPSSEIETLTRQVKDLTSKYEQAQRAIADKEIASFLTGQLSERGAQMIAPAVKLLKDNFKFEDGNVVIRDEYGDLKDPSEAIDKFLNDNPGFKKAKNQTGTAKSGSSSGVRSAAVQELQIGTGVSDGTMTREQLISIAGDEETARKLKWI